MSYYDDSKMIAEKDRDALTGVYEKKAAEIRINELLNISRGAMILVDIYDFAQINTKYGHLAGDRALIRLAAILQRMVLKSDIIARVGGASFLIFIRGERTEAFIRERARQIRTRVMTEEFPEIGAKAMRLSFGWAIGEIDDTYESMHARAQDILREDALADEMDTAALESSIRTDGKKIRSALKEQDRSGAYYQEYEYFKAIYRYTERLMKRSGRRAFLLLLTLAENDGRMPEFNDRAYMMRELRACIQKTLRSSDVFTQYSSGQFLIMTVDTDMEYAERIAERVRKAFYKNVGATNTNLLLQDSYPMGIENKDEVKE